VREVIIIVLAFFFSFVVVTRAIGATAFYIHFYLFFIWKMKFSLRHKKEKYKQQSESNRRKLADFFIG